MCVNPYREKKRKTGTTKQISGLVSICILLMFFVTSVSASLTLRYNKTSNTVGNSVWNETFASAGNKTFYVSIPKNATVTNAKLNLSGYKSIRDIDVENASNIPHCSASQCGGYMEVDGYTSWGSIYTNAVDEDWNSLAYAIMQNNVNMSYVNYSIDNYNFVSFVNWTVKSSGIDPYGDGTTYQINLWCYNYTSSSWLFLENYTPTTKVTMIPSSCFNNSILQLRWNQTSNATDSNRGFHYFWEEKITLDNAIISNPYLDVSGDGDAEWSFSGNFNQTNNQTSDFSSEINSYLKTCYPYPDGTCNVPFIIHSDSAGVMQVRLNATITYDAETFENPVYEGQTSNFWVKVNSTPDISNVNAWLVYNGTSYAYTTKQQSGTYWIFTRSFTVPTVSADSNISFYWNFTYSNATSTYAQNFSSNNQTVYVLKLYNCTSGNFTLNFTGYDEYSKALMNYKMDATLTYWPSGKSFTKNFSFSYTGNNTYFVCIAPSTAILYSDADVKYWNDSYSTRYYYLQNAILTNSTQNIKLYLLNSSESTLITMIVKDQVENPVGNEIVLVQKQEIGAGTYTQVSEAKSDFSGYAYTYLKLHENYKFFLTKDGIIQREFEPMQLESSTLTFYVSQIDIPEYFSYYDNVATSCTNISNILTCTWVDTSGLTADMNFYVGKIDQVGETTVCDNTSSGSSGTFGCDLSGGGNFRYVLKGTYHSNPITYVWQSGYIGGLSVVDFGVVGLVLTLLIVMFVSYMTHNDVKLCLVSTAFAIIFCSVISLIRFGADTMAMTFIIGITSGIVAFKIR